MIKIAIPIFLDRISPRLDCARRMLILHIEKNQLVDKRELDISHWPPDEKIFQLKQLGIEQLICGGLRLEDKIGLTRFGIRVASPFYGEVDSVIQDYLRGNLSVPCCQKGKERRIGKACRRKGLRKL
jgi:predicted Fe-Mo cluster-binding NifX family protein